MGADRRTGNSTPWTPHASALRSSVPTFWGSSSESSTSTNGGSPRSRARAMHVVERRPSARLHDQRHTLVAVEPGERRQRAALDLHDRDAQGRGMQHQLVERRASLRHHQQTAARPSSGEGLLHGPTTRHELLVIADLLRGREGSRRGPGCQPASAGRGARRAAAVLRVALACPGPMAGGRRPLPAVGARPRRRSGTTASIGTRSGP